MDYVLHNKWFRLDYADYKFRGKYIGFISSSFSLQIKKKYLFFNIWITVIKNTSRDSRFNRLNLTSDKSIKYSAKNAKDDLIEVANVYLEDFNVCKHTYYLNKI